MHPMTHASIFGDLGPDFTDSVLALVVWVGVVSALLFILGHLARPKKGGKVVNVRPDKRLWRD